MRQRSVAVPDGAGRMQATAFQSGAQTDLAFTAGLNGKVGSNASDVGLLNSSLAQLTIPLYRHGQYGKVRLSRERGRLQPDACTLDLEFTSVEDYARAIRADFATQTARDGERTAKPSGSNADAIATHLAEARHHARNNQTFVIRKRLNTAVARAIDRNAGAAEIIRRCEHLGQAQRDGLCRQLDAESTDLLAHAHSWAAPELKVMERSGRLRRIGLQSALRLASESSVEGERCLANLVLDAAV